MDPTEMPKELYNMFCAIRDYYSEVDFGITHVVTAAADGEEWAARRIMQAIESIDRTHPSGAVPRGGFTP